MKNRNKRITAKILVMALLMSMLSFSGIQVSAGWCYEDGGFRWESDEEFVHRLFYITYNIKVDEDENTMYVNTMKPFTLIANNNGGHVVVESNAEFGISFYERSGYGKTTDGKPVITINKGVTATIYTYGHSIVEATKGPAIYNEGTLNIVGVSGASLRVIGGEGGSAISGPGVVNISKADLTVKGGSGGAGIESSDNPVTISDSKVTAEGGSGGAAIGGASGESSNHISISNSTVTAKGGEGAAAIGGGNGGGGELIDIFASMITAEGGENAYDIGNGANNSSTGRITIDDNSSVKASTMSKQPQNTQGQDVKLFEIDNSNSANIMIDGKLFPYCNHFDEKKVYAYLTDTSHSIEVNSNRFGDFVVKGYDESFNLSDIKYNTYNRTLTVNTSAPLEIANINPMQATGDRIIIAKDVAANVTLAGVNIAPEGYVPAFEIEYNSAANVSVNLKNGTNNFLTGGERHAGLQKSQGAAQEIISQGHSHPGQPANIVDRPVETGTLTISGEGNLWANGGWLAPGIGSNYGSAVENIVIESGNIITTGGGSCAGIGGKMAKKDDEYFAVGNIEIRGGNIRVVGGEAAPAIGGVSVAEQRRDSSIKIWSFAKVEAISGSDMIPTSYIPVYNELGKEVVPFHISNPDKKEIYFDNYYIGSTERGYELFATKEIHSVQVGDKYKFYDYSDAYETFREFTPDANYDTGDFTVTGGVPCADYFFKDGVLNIRSPRTTVKIKNTNPNKATTDRIVVRGSADCNFTLDGVNIEAEDGKPALFIENGIKADVNITLAEDSVNVFAGGSGCAALDKTGGESTGKLHINGNGALYALGGAGGAGIGSSGKNSTANIYIDGGCVTAIGGENAYDIGSGFKGKISVLCIEKEASVKVNNMGCNPYIMKNGQKADVALLKIYNPEGKDVYINDVLLPLKQHLGGEEPEDYLYIYLPGGAYGVRLGTDGEEEEFNVETDTGDFVVSGYGTNFTNGILTVNTKDRIVISNKNPDVPTTDCIYIPNGIDAHITLAGVNIKTKNENGGIKIDDNHTGKVTLTLADTTQNNIVSEYSSIPGILMQNVDCTLEIKGNGSLNVTGGGWAPGIGSSTHGRTSSSFGAGTFIISGGKITAKGYDVAPSINPGIGYCLDGRVEPATTKKIVISENASVKSTLGTTPVNAEENGEKVYLYAVENSNKENIFVNGRAYPHTNQNDDDSNVYLYLPAMRIVSSGMTTSRVDNKIVVGKSTDYVQYKNNEWVQNGHFEFSVNDLTYNGEEQIPFTIKGTVPNNTTVTYSKERYGTFTGEIPKFKCAGEYTVWCSVRDIYGTQISPINVEIKKAPLTVTAKPSTVTYGDEPSADGVTYEGFVNGETEAVLSGALDYSFDYEKWGDAGTYTITPFGLTSDNYEITFETSELTVNKKELSKEDITVQNSGTVICDGEMHTAYVSLNENRSGVGKLTVKYTKDGTSFIDKPTEVGTYDIYVAALGGTNYLETQGNGINTGKTLKIIEASEENSLLLNISGKAFLVTPSGKDKDKGVVIVSLYDSEKMNRLVDVKLFDLSEKQIPFGTFDGDGSFIKAMWWSDLSTMTPLCEAKCYPPVEAAPTPTPTPGGDDSGYTSDDYGGGDSGGGISDFSGGGSGGQSTMPDSLPTPIGARLVYDSSNKPIGVDIIENATLKEDGTINSTNINFANDKNLAKAVAATNEILEKECGFKKHLCLAVFNKVDKLYPIKIKLDPTYRNKKAYIFHYDKNGNLVNAAPGLKYITKILSAPDFVDDILSMNIEPFETVIIGFGTK